MRIQANLQKGLKIVQAVELIMQATGMHVHGLSGDELASITTNALQKGHDIASSVKDLGLEAKTAMDAPEAH